MKKSRIVFLCVTALVCALVFAGCARQNTASALEVQNSGTAIQWKRSDETEWHDLVALSDLMGAAGQDGKAGADGVNGKDGADGVNGKDGTNGVNGKDGANGKSIEVRKSDGAVQWRCEGGQWQDLVALSDITGPAGMNGEKGETGQAGTDGKTPEFRVENGALQWRYAGDAVWLNLYDLTTLQGADGSDGKDGLDGKDGTNGTNGVGIAKTEISASGELLITYTNGITVNLGKVVGEDGRDGIDGTNGTDGKDGTDGKNGACPGYFYATGVTGDRTLDRPIGFSVKTESGGLVYYDWSTNSITLKKGHTYNVCFSGNIWVSTNGGKNETDFYVWLTDGYQENNAMYSTQIRAFVEGKKFFQMQVPMTYNRLYVVDSKDVTLRYNLVKGTSYTYIDSFTCDLTITALN